MDIAFVMLSFAVNVAAGIERSIAALAVGLHRLGHRVTIITATPSEPFDPVTVIPLTELRLDTALTEDALLASLASSSALSEVHGHLEHLRPDVICWADATWGLGFDATGHGGRSVLMVHVMRDDPLFRQALARGPSHVLVPSAFVLNQAIDAGFDTSNWRVVPNGLLPERKAEHEQGHDSPKASWPVRLIARLEPQKGVEEFLMAAPPGFAHVVDIVVAAAGFEYFEGMQETVEQRIRSAGSRVPAVRIHPPLAWREVAPFLSGAAVCVIPSIEPETFGLVALEAMSVGTPVCSYALGHLPALLGEAGRLVPLNAGPSGLWTAVDALLRDEMEYEHRCHAALRGSQKYGAESVARQFLDVVLS
jgi:glycosyltransferase involved in cell wall biosynthesis